MRESTQSARAHTKCPNPRKVRGPTQSEQAHSVWTPFHSMYENFTLCTNWFVHQANTAGAFSVHQANAAGTFIVHQGNVVEHFGSYIKAERISPTVRLRYECAGRQVRGRGPIARSHWVRGPQWRVEWAALPTHLPRTCHAMPTQCNRGSTRVGRDEPQSPGTLRVNSPNPHVQWSPPHPQRG